MEQKLTNILKLDYSHTVPKDDVIIVYQKNGHFMICDKTYGVQEFNEQTYNVLRVFGQGKGKVSR